MLITAYAHEIRAGCALALGSTARAHVTADVTKDDTAFVTDIVAGKKVDAAS